MVLDRRRLIMPKEPKKSVRTNDSQSRDKFIQHLEKTSEKVRQWPEWKKGIWGPALPEEMHS